MEHGHAISPAAGGQTWAIVLAAGSGTRLSSLTRDSAGAAVPKQFCSLDGESTLIEQSLMRAANVVDKQRVTAVVAPAHRCYWQPVLRDLPTANIVVQPYNRGTAIGILLPTLRIVARDPHARILILPSDHHVGDEEVLAQAMRTALEDIRRHFVGVALLGIEADEPDPELGYIVPHTIGHPRLRRVHRFAEKPSAHEACRLIREGALWNSFILACRATSLIDLLLQCCPGVVQTLQSVGSYDEIALEQLYLDFPDIDFSRHIATGQEHRLAVVPVPRCGWNDLGTPHRLAQTLARWPKRDGMTTSRPRDKHDGWINLADRLAQVHPALLLDA